MVVDKSQSGAKKKLFMIRSLVFIAASLHFLQCGKGFFVSTAFFCFCRKIITVLIAPNSRFMSREIHFDSLFAERKKVNQIYFISRIVMRFRFQLFVPNNRKIISHVNYKENDNMTLSVNVNFNF